MIKSEIQQLYFALLVAGGQVTGITEDENIKIYRISYLAKFFSMMMECEFAINKYTGTIAATHIFSRPYEIKKRDKNGKI